LNEKEYTNVFSSYTTDANQSTIHPCEDLFAIYPTMDGIQQLVHSMKINHEVVNNSVEDIQDIFKSMNFEKWIHEDILYGKRPYGEVEPNNATQIRTKFISKRKAFLRNHPIRFAIVGGLHRCGLLLHMLENYVIHNGRPVKATNKTYNFNGESSFNCKVPVHIITQKEEVMNDIVIQACRDFSKVIQGRKNESFAETIKSEMYSLLSRSSSDDEKINEKRYLEYTYWTKDEVSSFESLQHKLLPEINLSD
jgi:hypothetical protein